MSDARFYEGASMKTTRSLNQQDKVKAVQKNSMKGLPGFIRTKADSSSGGLADSKPVGPRFNAGESHETTTKTRQFRKSQGAEIGRRGGSANPDMVTGKFRGSSDRSYRATSTAAPGRIASNRGEPERRGKSEAEGAQRGKPTSGFKQATVKTKSLPPQGAGHAGRMESLRGRAKTSWER